MEFVPCIPFDRNQAQHEFWDALKDAFPDDDGVAFYRYPVFRADGQVLREPDVVFAHRNLGVWTFEVKGCRIGNIEQIQGYVWRMQDWHSETESPFEQARGQMFAVQGILHRNRFLFEALAANRIAFHAGVILPFVSQREWQDAGLDHQISGFVLFSDTMRGPNLRNVLRQCAADRTQLSEGEWMDLVKALGGTVSPRPVRPIPLGAPQADARRVINHIEETLKPLDGQQRDAAFQVPPGPQRLRGLAGSGKTLLLAWRAARIHAAHPNWDIAFVFFTKSLYQHVRNLIARCYRDMTDGGEPNWDKLRVLHAWGGGQQTGFYSLTCLSHGIVPASAQQGDVGPQFQTICAELWNQIGEQVHQHWDCILIDEGQDLPPEFYRIAFHSLREPKRLYWAYDEAQGIGSMIVPEPSVVFGRDDTGAPVVNLQGKYSGGISKGVQFKRSYRTPQRILMAAHALNMGLYREQGPLQAPTQGLQWGQIGYKLEDGDFRAIGKPVTISRPIENSCHPVDHAGFPHNEALGETLFWQSFDADEAEIDWVASRIRGDIDGGLSPQDILVTGPRGNYDFGPENHFIPPFYIQLARRLLVLGVTSHFPSGADDFFVEGHVTIANIFRAKGNEAWKTYVCRFQHAIEPWGVRHPEGPIQAELEQRNQAFTALTRAKVWCVVSGRSASPIWNELAVFAQHYPHFRFPAFNRGTLSRHYDHEDAAEPLL